MNRLEEEIRCIQSSLNWRRWILANNECIQEDRRLMIEEEIQLLENELKKRLGRTKE
jgi:hypothetical protein